MRRAWSIQPENTYGKCYRNCFLYQKYSACTLGSVRSVIGFTIIYHCGYGFELTLANRKLAVSHIRPTFSLEIFDENTQPFLFSNGSLTIVFMFQKANHTHTTYA